MRVILAAVDLGADAQHVLESAAALARQAGAALHVVHVSASIPPDGGLSAAAETLLAREREELGVLTTRCCGPALVESQLVLTGRTADTILARAGALRADLIVLGTHAGGERAAGILGTTAERVVRGATAPCLIVRAPLRSPLSPIAVATDFSAGSVVAAHVAAEWLRTFGGPAPGSQLHLLHVGWPIELLDDAGIEARTLRPKLREIEQELASADAPAITSHVLWSNHPATALAGWARTHDCALLVLGTTGRGAVRELLVGSVASSVARQAPCAVLLVPRAAARTRAESAAPRASCALAAIDFSAASLAATDWLRAAFAPHARHVLVHVIEPPDTSGFAAGDEEVRSRMLEHAHAEADARLTRLFPDTPPADRRTTAGQPAEELVRSARASNADLICIGAHTHPHGMWGMLGTTAEQLIRTSPVPVLIVRGRPDTAPQRILAAIDNSRESMQALRWAGALARDFTAELQVVHVLSARYIGAARLVSGMAAARELESSYADQAQAWVRERISAAGIDPSSCAATVLIGAPTYELLALQQRANADLLVLGNRGYGAIAGALIGSVAAGVVRGAPCPVLLVPAAGE